MLRWDAHMQECWTTIIAAMERYTDAGVDEITEKMPAMTSTLRQRNEERQQALSLGLAV